MTTTVPGLGELIERGRDIGLFEQIDEDVYECRLCDSTDVDVSETPSMYGGNDASQHCKTCRAYTVTDPFTGVTSIYRKTAAEPPVDPAVTARRQHFPAWRSRSARRVARRRLLP